MSIATELTALSGHITNAYDAVNTKGGTIPANKNMANLDDAILSIPSGGQITNGTVEQYKALSTTVPADTFFEFVPKFAVDDPTFLQFSPKQATNSIEARSVAMDNDTVLQMYYFSAFSSNPAGNYIIAYNAKTGEYSSPVCPLTSGTQPATSARLENAHIYRLNGTKFLVVVPATVNDVEGAYAIVGTMSGLTLSFGSPVLLSNSTGFWQGNNLNGYDIAILSDSLFCCVYQTATRYYNAIVGSVSGTTITLGTEVTGLLSKDSTSISTTYNVHVDPIDNTSFLAVYNYSSSSTQCRTLTVDPSTLSVTQSSGHTLGNYKLYAPAKLKYLGGSVAVLLAFFYQSTTRLSVTFIDTDSMTILGERIDLNSVITQTSNLSSTFYCNDEKIAVIYTPYNNTAVFYSVSIDATHYTASAESLGNIYQSTVSSYTYPVTTTSGDIAFGANNSSYLRAAVISDKMYIRASQTKINGVTIDDITASSPGDTWIFADDVFYNGDADIRRF